MDILAKPSLTESVEALRDRDEYKVIIQFIRDERERFFGDLRVAQGEADVMKIAGSISTLDELLQLLQ